MTEPCDLSAVTARRLIGEKKLSPVELLASCEARVAAMNPAINAMVALDSERALVAAKAALKLAAQIDGMVEIITRKNSTQVPFSITTGQTLPAAGVMNGRGYQALPTASGAR